MSDFFKCLFDAGEVTCFADTPKGTDIRPRGAERPDLWTFFAINALDGARDSQPTQEWHRTDLPRRADCNVITFRNILVEFDTISLEEQRHHVETIGLPYSTAVYSGSKSIHYIISLETPLQDVHKYRAFVKRVYRAVDTSLVDRANANPSRLSRVPGHMRPDTGKAQELIAVRGRVPNTEVEAWLISRGAVESEWEEISNKPTGRPRDFSSLSGFTKNFLMGGCEKGQWNFSLFKAAADLCRNGYSQDEAYQQLLAVTGTLDRNDEKTITSAFRNEEGKKYEQTSA